MSNQRKELLSSVKDLFGPASVEIGQLVADNVRLWRWQRALKILNRASEIRRDYPDQAAQISLKFFLPFIEEASKETDDELSEWWAQLLASSSDRSSGFDQRCVDILRSIGSLEAGMIMKMPELVGDEYEAIDVLTEISIESQRSGSDWTTNFFQRIHQDKRLFILEERRKGWREWERDLKGEELQAFLSLERLGLIAEKHFPLEWIDPALDRYEISHCTLARLGKAFLARMGALRR